MNKIVNLYFFEIYYPRKSFLCEKVYYYTQQVNEFHLENKYEHTRNLYFSILKNPEKYTDNKDFLARVRNYSYSEKQNMIDILTWACTELDPKVFEQMISFWFNKNTGYKTALADDIYEMQYDIKGVWEGINPPKGKKFIAIQCKRWSPSMQMGKGKITMNIITQIYGKADKIIKRSDTQYAIVTTTYLNADARKYADEHDIDSVDFSQIPLIIEDVKTHGFCFPEQKRIQQPEGRFILNSPKKLKTTSNNYMRSLFVFSVLIFVIYLWTYLTTHLLIF